MYTSNQGQLRIVFNCLFLFIPAKNFNDTTQYLIIKYKDILCMYTSYQGQIRIVFNCLFLFIPATNLDDTRQYLIIKQQI
jgi:hypothetical protein